jgi:hypothetical protein
MGIVCFCGVEGRKSWKIKDKLKDNPKDNPKDKPGLTGG